MEIAPKISTSNIGLAVPTTVDEVTPAAKIAGTISGIKTGETQYGPYTGFVGDFICRRPDGTEFRTDTLYLPGTITDMLTAAFKASPGTVDFSYEVSSPDALLEF